MAGSERILNTKTGQGHMTQDCFQTPCGHGLFVGTRDFGSDGPCAHQTCCWSFHGIFEGARGGFRNDREP